MVLLGQLRLSGEDGKPKVHFTQSALVSERHPVLLASRPGSCPQMSASATDPSSGNFNGLFSAFTNYLGTLASSLAPMTPEGRSQCLPLQQPGCHSEPSFLDPLSLTVTWT